VSPAPGEEVGTVAPPDDRSPRSVLVSPVEPERARPIDEPGAEAVAGGVPGAAGAAGAGDEHLADDPAGVEDRAPSDDRAPSEQWAPAAGRAGAPTGRAGTPAVHPRVWQRRVAVLRDQGRRRLRWVVAAAVVLLAVCVAVVLLHTPLAAVRQTTVVGAVHTPVAAVVDAAGLADGPPLIDVDPAAAAAKVEALPWVARAAVVRHWPDAVTVTVTERVALGSVARPGGNVALVDASGRVLAWQPGPAVGVALSVPVAPGRPGTDLAAADRPALVVGAALAPALLERVQSLRLGPGGDVVLSLSGRLTVDLGTDSQLGAKLASLSAVLEEAHPVGPAVIDLTIPDQPAVGAALPAAGGPPAR